MSSLQQDPVSPDTVHEKNSGWLLKLAPFLLLVTGVAAAWYLLNTAPRAGTVKQEPKARLVSVETIETKVFLPVISVSGEVRAAQKMSLSPRVSGRIEHMEDDLLPGSLVNDEDVLFVLDSADYELVVREKQTALNKANAELQQEKGLQAIALREYELMGQKLGEDDEALVLRKPQLAMAQATVDSAVIQLKQAQLDLARTRVEAPFNAQIIDRTVELGSEVNTSTALLELVNTDEFWLEVRVPLEQLQWISFPEAGRSGSMVSIRNNAAWKPDVVREGHVLSLLPELESGSRMARVLVSITDPLAQLPDNKDKPKVLVNDYLQADIQGTATKDLVSLPRAWLREGDQVWLMTDNETLEIREVDVRFRGQNSVLLNSGLNEGERLVTTMLPVAVEGMPLRLLPSQLTQADDETKNGEHSS